MGTFPFTSYIHAQKYGFLEKVLLKPSTQDPCHRDGVPRWAKVILSNWRIFFTQAASILHIQAMGCRTYYPTISINEALHFCRWKHHVTMPEAWRSWTTSFRKIWNRRDISMKPAKFLRRFLYKYLRWMFLEQTLASSYDITSLSHLESYS